MVQAFLYSGSIELNRFQWRPNLPFVISSKCLNKTTHNKKKHCILQMALCMAPDKANEVTGTGVCAFASEIADGLVVIKV